MNRLGIQYRKSPTFFPARISLIVLCLVVCGLVIVSCSSPDLDSQAELDATMEAAVEATVSAAVDATVAAQSGTSSTVAGMVESAAADTDSASNQTEGGDEAAASSIPELSEQELEVAQWVTSQTRHYIGDPNAPVVFIEFSDFQ